MAQPGGIPNIFSSGVGFSLESDSLLSERLSELRNTKRKGELANSILFVFRVSLLSISKLMDSRIVE